MPQLRLLGDVSAFWHSRHLRRWRSFKSIPSQVPHRNCTTERDTGRASDGVPDAPQAERSRTECAHEDTSDSRGQDGVHTDKKIYNCFIAKIQVRGMHPRISKTRLRMHSLKIACICVRSWERRDEASPREEDPDPENDQGNWTGTWWTGSIVNDPRQVELCVEPCSTDVSCVGSSLSMCSIDA